MCDGASEPTCHSLLSRMLALPPESKSLNPTGFDLNIYIVLNYHTMISRAESQQQALPQSTSPAEAQPRSARELSPRERKAQRGGRQGAGGREVSLPTPGPIGGGRLSRGRKQHILSLISAAAPPPNRPRNGR